MNQKRDVLTKKFAHERRLQVGAVHYDLQLWFEKKAKEYRGLCSISVDVIQKKALVLNTVSKVQSVHVNNKPCTNFKQSEYTLTIPASMLEKKNRIDIAYTATYDRTGSGLHHFTDPTDNNEYLYTQFEPFDAHRLFPCFDQPDIKATYQLTVSAPKDWKVITNTWEKESSTNKEIKTTLFKTTKPLSTYIFHVSAGPFAEFTDSFQKMPLRIFCRQSLKKWIPKKDMFTFTKQGLSFYSWYFGFKYPFDKYDQIFCPEFNHGAMENAGAITFSEHLLARRKLTHTERAELANVVLHEMVHMWFGDLVTMKWWDDIWLNESFADFLSYVGMYETTEFQDAWESFYTRKAWAYMQDQLVTTHPIANDAPDTDMAFANFDGISYAKGAATLKQLMFYIGEKAFRKGLKIYFNKYQWQNTTLKDFRKCLEKGAGKNLKKWFDAWIHTTGVNTVVPMITVTKENKIKELSITQKPSKNNGVLRPHKTRLALIYDETAKIIEFTYATKKTVINAVKGWPVPNIVHVNFGDHDYAKTVLDKTSIQHTLRNAEAIVDPLVRHVLYGDLWQMVRDAKLNPRLYFKMVLYKAPLEKNLELLEQLIGRATTILARYIPDKEYEARCLQLYELSQKMLFDKKTLAKTKHVWFDALLMSSAGANKSKELATFLSKKKKIQGLVIDQDKRWRILIRLAAVNHPGIATLLKKEHKTDNTDLGAKFLAMAQTAQVKNKDAIFKKIVRAEGPSLDYVRRQMSAFYWRSQKKELVKFVPRFFAHVKDVYENQDRMFAQAYFTFMFPSMYTSKKVVSMTKHYYTQHQKTMPMLLKKSLREAVDEMQRTLAIREKYDLSG